MRLPSSTFSSWQYSGFPLTIAIMVITFLVLTLSLFAPASQNFLGVFALSQVLEPWRLVTYPFLSGPGFLSFLFHIGLIYWLYGSLERSWGTKNFAIFYLAVTVGSILVLCLGGALLKTPIFSSHWLPLASCAVAWGFLNSEERISFWFIPMKGIFIAIIGVLLLVFEYGRLSPALIPFSLGGCAIAYVWINYRSWASASSFTNPRRAGTPRLRMVPGKSRPADDRFTLRKLNPAEWFASRRRKKKFERLMKDD